MGQAGFTPTQVAVLGLLPPGDRDFWGISLTYWGGPLSRRELLLSSLSPVLCRNDFSAACRDLRVFTVHGEVVEFSPHCSPGTHFHADQPFTSAHFISWCSWALAPVTFLSTSSGQSPDYPTQTLLILLMPYIDTG